jgi:metal-dependent amidase/aminoacylase/carboxypeptidase family protein
MASDLITLIRKHYKDNKQSKLPSSLNIGVIQGGTLQNVIAKHTQIIGSFRSYSEEDTTLIKQNI